MATVFSNQYEVHPTANQTIGNCYKDLTQKVLNWVSEKYLRSWKIDFKPSINAGLLNPIKDHLVNAESKELAGYNLFELNWRHPDENDPNFIWEAFVILVEGNNKIEVDVTIKTIQQVNVIKPNPSTIGRPRLINEILSNYEVSYLGWKIPKEQIELNGSEVEGYVNEIILNDKRTIPVVVISKDQTGSTHISPNLLFNSLKGLCHLVVLKDKYAGYVLTNSLTKELSCYWGAVRIYWPFMTVNDSPWGHTLWLAKRLIDMKNSKLKVEKIISEKIFSAYAVNHAELPLYTDYKTKLNFIEREHQQAILNRIENGELEKGDLENKLKQAFERIDFLSKEIEKKDSEIKDQRALWAQYQTALATQEQHEQPAPEQQEALESVYDAVLKAEKDFKGYLVFLDKTKESAKDSNFKQPEKVYQLFEALSEYSCEIEDKGTLGQDLRLWLKDKGFNTGKVSQTSKGKWGQEYEIIYKGKKIFLDDHVTIGAKQDQKCISVHWFKEKDSHQIFIGHCGKHKTNTFS